VCGDSQITKNRLVAAVLEGKPSNVARVELLGKFCEHDWRVHASDVKVGIFAELAWPELGQLLEASAKNLSEYLNETDGTDQAPAPEEKQPE